MQSASTGRAPRRAEPTSVRGGLPFAHAADADLALQTARQTYLDAFHIPAGVIVLEEGEPRVAACNALFARVCGDGARSAAGLVHAITTFFAGDQDRHDLKWHQPGIAGRSFSVHFSRLGPYGAHATRALVSLVDRTAEVETARSLRAEMLHDSLTGLPNRVAFGETIEGVIESGAQTFAVLAVDLNRFSRINECVGALAGDELIITVARRLMTSLREGDMLARMAGDEFGVLLNGIGGEDDVVRAAERLQAALFTPIRLSELEIRIDCSIGGAVSDERVKSSGELLRNAQVALKRAKLSGRAEVYRQGEVNLARRRFSLETELRRAIDREELSLAFQPLLHLETGKVSGYEALARWEHREHGSIPATEFISVAEDSGLIVPLGRWALDAAARTLAEWDARTGTNLPLRICINVSPVQLARDKVDEAVVQVLDRRNVDGNRLTLELTEGSIVADPGRAKRVLGALHELGCRVAMDDFGTGYSSLAYLQKLPIDILKIDRSFVSDMLENTDSVAIIRAILSLAQTLGMATTAEGVENEATAQMLRTLRCDTGQGFHFARPLAPDDALAFYLDRSA